jgi:tRNA modification GTPase
MNNNINDDINMQNNIMAISTAHGSGGVGIIRISGYDLSSLGIAICNIDISTKPRYAHLINIIDFNDVLIDKVIAIYFKNPYSYTGEDVLELQAHGGMIVMDMLLQHCLELGKKYNLRMAEAGEFTKRAFLNGKIDLIQAEAVIDIINAHSQSAVRCANQSLQGHFSNAINALLEKLIYLRLNIESSIDFPEEDLDYSHMHKLINQFEFLIAELDTISTKAGQGYLLGKGTNVVLVGAPNVGKSSLINALSQTEISIVTPIAGTTRDKISIDIQINGVYIKLIDTAGLRETNDSIEEIGISRTWEAINNSSIVLYLTSVINDYNNDSNDEELLNTIQQRQPHINIINVCNKVDLLNQEQRQHKNDMVAKNIDKIYISTKTEHGLDILRQKILDVIGYKNNTEGVFLARKRHIEAINNTSIHINAAFEIFNSITDNNAHIDLIAEELRIAQEYLNSITGAFNADDLLGKIFSEFCIGK